MMNRFNKIKYKIINKYKLLDSNNNNKDKLIYIIKMINKL